MSKRCLALAAALVVSAPAFATVTVEVRSPIAGAHLYDAFDAEVKVTSDREVASVVATIGAVSCTFDAAGGGVWQKRCSGVVGPLGAATFTATATDVDGATGTAGVPVVINRRPRIELLDGSMFQVPWPTGRIHARCVDDGPGECVLTVTVNDVQSVSVTKQVIQVQAPTEIDVTLGACDPSFSANYFFISATDTAGGPPSQTSGRLSVERSPHLRRHLTVSGTVADFDGSRLLYAGRDDRWHLATVDAMGSVGSDSALEAIDPWCAETRCAWLTDSGAAWRTLTTLSSWNGAAAVVREWRLTNPVHAGDFIGDTSFQLGVANVATGVAERIGGGEVAVLADGRYLFSRVNDLLRGTLGVSPSMLVVSTTAAQGNIRAPALSDNRIGYALETFDDRVSLHVLSSAGETVVNDVASTRWLLNDDFIAFTRREGDATGIFVRDAAGTESRVGGSSASAQLTALAPNGDVTWRSGEHQYFAGPNRARPALELSNQESRPVAVGNSWYVLEGDTVFALSVDEGGPQCPAAVVDGGAGGGGGDGVPASAPPKMCSVAPNGVWAVVGLALLWRGARRRFTNESDDR